MNGDRLNMVDLRFTRTLRVNGTRASLNVDLYNMLNGSPVLTQNDSFAVWQQPLSILPARFAMVGVTFEF